MSHALKCTRGQRKVETDRIKNVITCVCASKAKVSRQANPVNSTVFGVCRIRPLVNIIRTWRLCVCVCMRAFVYTAMAGVNIERMCVLSRRARTLQRAVRLGAVRLKWLLACDHTALQFKMQRTSVGQTDGWCGFTTVCMQGIRIDFAALVFRTAMTMGWVEACGLVDLQVRFVVYVVDGKYQGLLGAHTHTHAQPPPSTQTPAELCSLCTTFRHVPDPFVVSASFERYSA